MTSTVTSVVRFVAFCSSNQMMKEYLIKRNKKNFSSTLTVYGLNTITAAVFDVTLSYAWKTEWWNSFWALYGVCRHCPSRSWAFWASPNMLVSVSWRTRCHRWGSSPLDLLSPQSWGTWPGGGEACCNPGRDNFYSALILDFMSLWLVEMMYLIWCLQ